MDQFTQEELVLIEDALTMVISEIDKVNREGAIRCIRGLQGPLFSKRGNYNALERKVHAILLKKLG